MYSAGEWTPLKIYNTYYVQKERNHGALVDMCVSTAVRVGCPSGIVGVPCPMRVLKSPQTIVYSWGCILSIIADIWSVASVSGMFRFFREVVGGK